MGEVAVTSARGLSPSGGVLERRNGAWQAHFVGFGGNRDLLGVESVVDSLAWAKCVVYERCVIP